MSEQLRDKTPIKPKIWLGICVGILTQLGLKAVLPIAVLVAIRMWSLETDDNSLWLEHTALPLVIKHVIRQIYNEAFA